MLALKDAIKLPVVFYGKVKFSSLQGTISILAPLKFAMVGFGQRYELMIVSKKNAQLHLGGKFIVRGHIQFGIDYLVYIGNEGILEMGHLSSLGGNGKIICFNHIVFGNYARIGYESQVVDTSSHLMKDLESNTTSSLTEPIILGNFNYIGNRVTILKSTVTPNNCTIASNSLLTKDYQGFGEFTLIGGIPCKLIRKNISRAWEEENIDNYLII